MVGNKQTRIEFQYGQGRWFRVEFPGTFERLKVFHIASTADCYAAVCQGKGTINRRVANLDLDISIVVGQVGKLRFNVVE